MNSFAIRVLRAFIVATFLGGLFGQVVVIPTMASDQAELYPELTPLVTPYSIAAIVAIACVQAALVAVWMLLLMVYSDAIFTERAFRWVDLVIGAAIVGTVVTAGVAGHLWTSDTALSISAVLAVTAGMFGGFVFVLFMVVMRGVLRKATTIEGELAGVV